MTDLQVGDRVKVVTNSNLDTKKGAVGEIINLKSVFGNKHLLRFKNKAKWWVRSNSLVKCNRLFNPITNVDGTR